MSSNLPALKEDLHGVEPYAGTQPGIVRGLASADYHAIPALSNSSMRDLEVSPLRFWHRHINPDRPVDTETPAMRLGTALHCAVLEYDKFDQRYAPELNPPEGCLVTMEDLRGFIRAAGQTPKGTRKAEAIAQVQSIDPDVPILEVQEQRHAIQHQGKVILSADEWNRVAGMAKALADEPQVQALLATGSPEVSMLATDPATGAPLKARMDWVSKGAIVDLKTFSAFRGKPIERAVADAIWYEKYYRMAYFYRYVRSLLEPGSVDTIIVFVESEEPHEVRIRKLRSSEDGQANMYWQRAQIEVRGMIQSYADYRERFGDKPWRDAAAVETLTDEEMPGLAY